MADEYIRKADAVERMNRYGSIWMEYTEAMSKHEVAEQALKASKQAVIDVLENLPSADVVPVERSKWIKTEDGAECENCGREAVYQIVDDHWEYEPWCPHCGARMDEGKE